jgi:hypothetical protein
MIYMCIARLHPAIVGGIMAVKWFSQIGGRENPPSLPSPRLTWAPPPHGRLSPPPPPPFFHRLLPFTAIAGRAPHWDSLKKQLRRRARPYCPNREPKTFFANQFGPPDSHAHTSVRNPEGRWVWGDKAKTKINNQERNKIKKGDEESVRDSGKGSPTSL